MSSIKGFESPDLPLVEVLQHVQVGKIQLPDFQRGWIWDDEHIRSLLASISLSYPIGVAMMLQTGNPDVRFQLRLVEGVDSAGASAEPERLILDGQQRLTSLFQALLSGNPVRTKDARDKPIERWYYIDIVKALEPDGDREDAIVGLPADRMIHNFRGEVLADYSTTQLECKHQLFPLQNIFDVARLTDWMMGFQQADSEEREVRLERWKLFVEEVVQRFQQYQLPVIVLRKETPKEAVCQVFEKVNTGGVPLTVFELLTATFAADNFNLRDDWDARRKRLRSYSNVLHAISSDDLLQAVTLLATRARNEAAISDGLKAEQAPAISCKRRDILRLTLSDYERWAEPATEGFLAAAPLLRGQYIFNARDLPYKTQLVPLAAILASLGKEAEVEGAKQMLRRWLWCGILGELYGSATESRFARDLPEVVKWVRGGLEPTTIEEANFSPGRLLTLRTRNSAAYKGVHALLMKQGSKDFRTGDPVEAQTFFDEKIDIHHIFPQKWCRDHGIDPGRCDSIVNKAPLSAKTNRSIGGNAPSRYLGIIERAAKIDATTLDSIVATHLIDFVQLRGDDFDRFFSHRERKLLEAIESAIGKPVVAEYVEVPEEEPAEFEADEAVEA